MDALTGLFMPSSPLPTSRTAFRAVENRPSFVDTPPSPPSFLATHYRIIDRVTGRRAHGIPYDRAYTECLVYVVGCRFLYTFAFGGDANEAFGGALFLQESQLSVSNGSSFLACRAFAGGAMAALDTELLVVDADFADCLAFYACGAVFARFAAEDNAQEPLAHFRRATFLRCRSREMHGGLALLGFADAVVDHCRFECCCAATDGGALSAVGTTVLVIRTLFLDNCAGNSTDVDLAFHHAVRAARGGAVFAAPANGAATAREPFVVATEECCFLGNAVIASHASFDAYVGAGAIIQSYADRFLNPRAVSVEGALATYHSFFFGDVDVALFFPAGHPCSVSAFELRFASFDTALPPLPTPLGSAALIAVDGVPGTLDGSPPRTEPALPEARTRPTPLGQVGPTEFTFVGPLTDRAYTRHSTGTGTVPFSPSAPLSASSPFADLQTMPFSASSALASSATLVPSRPFITPEHTINLQVETISLSFVTISLSVTISQSLEISFDAAGSRILRLHTVMVVIDIPVYTVLRSSLALGLRAPSSPDDSSALGAGIVIGISTGAAAAIALLIGAVIYVVRTRRLMSASDTSGGGEQTTQSRVSRTTVDVKTGSGAGDGDGDREDQSQNCDLTTMEGDLESTVMTDLWL
jgi:hypothetical protein